MVSGDFDLYNHACVETDEEGLRVLQEKNITYPVMIKASKGGGGKGIRKCNSDEEFKINFRRVKAEVPGSPIFLMKCMVNARHIQVQRIGDEYAHSEVDAKGRCQSWRESWLCAEDKSLPADVIRTDTEKCVIAVRIISEDPAEGFRPAFGNVESVQFQSNDEVWTYFSVSSPGMVQEYAALQFGHLFARGNSRRKAVSNLICALEELEVRATCTSQVSYLIGLLQDPKFERNNFHTDARTLSPHINIAIGATIIPTTDLADSWETELIYKKRKYDVLITWYSRINFEVSKNGSEAHEETGHYRVTIGKTLAIFGKENEPSILCSRNTGKLLQYNVPDGARVRVRDAYAEMESMTMVIPLEVEKAGVRIVYRARPGQALFPRTVIALLEDKEDTSLSKPVPFTGPMAQWDDDEWLSSLGNCPISCQFWTIEICRTACSNSYDMSYRITPQRCSEKEVIDSEEVLRLVYSRTFINNKAGMLKNIFERLDESTIVALREPLITISIFFIKECEKISIFVRTLLNKQHIAMMEDKFPQMLNDTDGSFSQASCVANNFLFTENADTNYAALAKIGEAISSVQPHQIKRIDIGCSVFVAKISLLSADLMSRVLANSGEGSPSVLFVVAVEAEGIC
ncbi:hypothetical protein QR680_000686 [Steinernema hermaphroditum]|uniref:Biotin carboxylation domain-containing protein n=1 Tax=Steinernema hermaphroditum TaxID=289476 RepID=A0AA39GX09_9BILA|nr:hypothetical protein QR680_000686 [Steinernema hermaphroditum]